MNIMHIGQYFIPRLCGKDGYYENFKHFFLSHDHKFYVFGKDTEKYFEGVQDIVISDRRTPVLEELLLWSDRIVLHAIPTDTTLLKRLRWYQKDKEKKIIWIVWGHDLYDAYWAARKLKKIRWRTIKHFCKSWRNERIRKKLIYDMAYIVGEKGDVDRAFEWYPTNAKKVYYNFIVGYGAPKPIELAEKESSSNMVKVLVGNHADAHCRYPETLTLLHSIDDGTLEVHLMMEGHSRENRYIRKILEMGQQYFQERFFTMFDWMSYEGLCKYINDMDVGIFNIDRQMAQGTSLIFIYYGKKVFFSEENYNYDNYISQGAKVFHMSEMDRHMLKAPMSDEDKKCNKVCIQNIMRSDYFYETMKNIFE